MSCPAPSRHSDLTRVLFLRSHCTAWMQGPSHFTYASDLGTTDQGLTPYIVKVNYRALELQVLSGHNFHLELQEDVMVFKYRPTGGVLTMGRSVLHRWVVQTILTDFYQAQLFKRINQDDVKYMVVGPDRSLSFGSEKSSQNDTKWKKDWQ